MDQPYSSFLFNQNHAANKTKTRPPTRSCCLGAYSKKDYILCATYPNQPRPKRINDDYDEEPLLEVNHLAQPKISHEISDDFEGPLWE